LDDPEITEDFGEPLYKCGIGKLTTYDIKWIYDIEAGYNISGIAYVTTRIVFAADRYIYCVGNSRPMNVSISASPSSAIVGEAVSFTARARDKETATNKSSGNLTYKFSVKNTKVPSKNESTPWSPQWLAIVQNVTNWEDGLNNKSANYTLSAGYSMAGTYVAWVAVYDGQFYNFSYTTVIVKDPPPPSEPDPIYKEPWFWVIIFIIIAAIAFVVWFFVIRKPPEQESYAQVQYGQRPFGLGPQGPQYPGKGY
ncbi:MAG: hypothetical protein QW728_05255, partial [Thermoplasmata archaeon]